MATQAQAPPAAAKAAVEFEALDSLVHVYRPPPIRERQKQQAELKKQQQQQDDGLAPVSTSRGPAPAAVLIQGWMDAPLRIVAKYAAPYARLFPDSTIVLQLSTGSSFMAAEAAKQKTARRVGEVLAEVETRMAQRDRLRDQERGLEASARQAGLRMDVDAQNSLARESKDKSDEQDSDSSIARVPRGVIIHTFSDGGATNLARFLPILAQTTGHPAVLSQVLDCCPGIATPSSGATAFTVPLARRSWLVRSAAWWSVWLYFGLLLLYRRLLGRRSWSEVMRHQLNNPARWSALAAGDAAKADVFPPRLYLYSKADQLIKYTAIEKHADEAAKTSGLQKGPLPVDTLKSATSDSSKANAAPAPVVAFRRWESAPHCDILRADAQGYWKALRQFYEAVL